MDDVTQGEDKSYTLYELNEFIRRVMALNFPDALWVNCELGEVKFSRGHCYLSLVQKNAEDDTVIAQSDAVIWQSALRGLGRKLGQELNALLAQGMAVRCRVRVSYSERYGLKLSIDDLDAAFTEGQLALRRRAIIAQLSRLGLLGKNAGAPLPLAAQRIAVVSTANAAGYQDFVSQLRQNGYGYQFSLRLFEAAVQGAGAAMAIMRQLARIAQEAAQFDAVVIVRGGGARLDLAAFDDFELSRLVADFPIPVLVGIGHETDETVLDKVAHSSLKTPTAVAEFVLQHNLRFEAALLDAAHYIGVVTRERIGRAELQVQSLGQQVVYGCQRWIDRQDAALARAAALLPQQVKFQLHKAASDLARYAALNDLLSPQAHFARGYSMALRDGKIVTAAADLSPGDRIETLLKDDRVASEVLQKPVD